MEYKKKSNLSKWYLKYTNKESYRQYKDAERRYKSIEDYCEKTINNPTIEINHLYKRDTTFKHSGNSGDIIYALPAILELAKNGNAHLLLHANQHLEHPYFHPLGNVMLNQKMIEMLQPLLLYQPGIKSCESYTGQSFDYDFDIFRKCSFPTDRGSISRWYFFVFGVFADLCKPWLIASKDSSYQDYIVIARSHRYRAPTIDYSFLKKYPKKLFLGVPLEYEDMKKYLPDIEYKGVNDFLEMATIINDRH